MSAIQKNFNRDSVKKGKSSGEEEKNGRHKGGPSNRVSRGTFGEERPLGVRRNRNRLAGRLLNPLDYCAGDIAQQ